MLHLAPKKSKRLQLHLETLQLRLLHLESFEFMHHKLQLHRIRIYHILSTVIIFREVFEIPFEWHTIAIAILNQSS